MTSIETNTKLFYEELNGHCDEKILLDLAKKGIFLYESLFNNDKIKNLDCVVDISILARQYFMINTISQYERFFQIAENFEDYNLFLLYKSCLDFPELIIINEFFLKQLTNDSDDRHLKLILNSLNNDNILKYLNKYQYISQEAFYLFDGLNIVNNLKFELFDYFYFNRYSYIFEEEITSFSFDKLYFIVENIIEYALDINMLKYCAELLDKYNIKLPSYLLFNFKIPLNFPLREIKSYSEKIFMPNRLMVRHEDKYFESLMNELFTDKFLFLYQQRESADLICEDWLLDKLNRYTPNKDTLKNSKIVIENTLKINPMTCNYENTFTIKNTKYYNTDSKENNIFSNYVLNNPEKINSLLKDSNYLFKLDIDFDSEQFLIYTSYIVSLIHNHYNKFVIKYLVSFLHLDDFIITFLDNKIAFYPIELYEYPIHNNYIDILLAIPHETFKSYIDLKEYDEQVVNDYYQGNYIYSKM